MGALTPTEAASFLAAAREDRFGLPFELLLVTGTRPSEVLAWIWGDFDLEHSSLAQWPFSGLGFSRSVPPVTFR